MKLANKELSEILEFLSEKIKGKGFNLQIEKNVFFDVIYRKKKVFEEFTRSINSKWHVINEKNQNRVIKKTYTSFLYENFHDFFKFYLQNFFGFDEKKLFLDLKEKISDKLLFLEYHYFLSPEEEKNYKILSEKLEGEVDWEIPMGYLYFNTAVLGIIIRKAIQEKLFIVLEAGVIKRDGNNNYMHFLIMIRDSKDDQLTYYLNMVLFYLFKRFGGVPEEYLEKLLKSRENLYQIALKEYPFTKERIVNLLYYFYKKSKILQNLPLPLLDFFNFVCSRVEDSIFSKIDIIKKEFIDNFDYSVEKKESLIRIFKFLDKKSVLYSTFMANHLPLPEAQFNLFVLYMRYYFGSCSLETLEVGGLLNLPQLFITKLNQYNKKIENEVERVIDAKSIRNIGKFMNSLSILSDLENINPFFQKIFNKSVFQINHNFFISFLFSLNTKFFTIINTENEILSENPQNEEFTFNIIADHISRMLYVLIDKIFLRNTPDEASKNFLDTRGRYIGKNIALRCLELFFFQIINLSDDIWSDFLISRNKVKIKKELDKYNVKIPEKYFYSVEALTKFMIPYNFQSDTNQIFFEEWLISDIIIPLNTFIQNVKGGVHNPSNQIEVYEKLCEMFLAGLKEEKPIREIKHLCKHIAPFFQFVE